MLGPPIDAWYVWIGVSLVSLAVLGVAVVATPEPLSNAEAAAETIEQVDSSRPPATATHDIDAERVRIGEYRLVLEGEDTERATIDHGRMAAAPRGTDLRRVALGASPESVFASEWAFGEAVEAARSEQRIVEPAGDRLVVRKVSYGGSNVLLVTA
ncbi:hypothetical protein L593_10455 [Salinarchaeum sp. Harcht-Bsk1]|uniref:DUF7283 family protein n=1 Tax=Salinarchaeum sp. Harcht-Bsk1 TaxID=1333523 RepID=UPI0003423A69|nr:hypothetical protein [Salinarchaeum sp. Harcht-Bsk1]AGN02036.1 hypothetical protein L593_10455 [Salinarchaeum sp. Harcht-Bsk1]